MVLEERLDLEKPKILCEKRCYIELSLENWLGKQASGWKEAFSGDWHK